MERRTGIIIVVGIGLVLATMGITAFLALRESERILSEFKQVNEELDSVSLTLSDQRSRGLTALYAVNCPEMVQQADSLHAAYASLDTRIDPLKAVLATYPKDDIDVADSLFEVASQGRALYEDLLLYYGIAERICANDSIDGLIEQKASMVRSAMNVRTWRERNFQKVPAIACRALLTKCQGDMSSTEALVLNDLLARCKPKGSP